MIRLLIASPLLLLLGACVTSDPDVTGSLGETSMPMPSPPAVTGDTATALASLPPEAGPVMQVTTQRSAAKVRQSITFDGAPSGFKVNQIILEAGAALPDNPDILLGKPTEAGIARELATEYPAMTMRVLDVPRTNAHGVYGLAWGRSDAGMSCIHAWQWLDRVRSGQSERAVSVALRLRFCSKTRSPDQLAAMADRLTLKPELQDAGAGTTSSPVQKLTQSVPRARRPAERQVRTTRSPFPVNAVESLRPAQADPAQTLDLSLPPAAFRGPANPDVTSKRS